MNKLSARLLCQVYILLVLLAATILSAASYSLLALALLLVIIFTTLRSLRVRLNIVINVATAFLLPQVLLPLLNSVTPLTQVTAQVTSVISIFPVIYLLDNNLRQNAQHFREFTRRETKGRYITNVSGALFASTLVVIILSFILGNTTLLFTDIIFVLYLLGILIRVFLAIPRQPFDAPNMLKRVIAGTTIEVSLEVINKASLKIHGLVMPADSWGKVTPDSFTLNRGKARLKLAFTPPKAGLSRPQFNISVIDPWGLTRLNQLLEPIELHVIPRARYAEWLARKYLQQTGTGVIAVTTISPETIKVPKRGIEYFDSRTYQPGDQLRDIDWKHTIKLNQLIVKEFIEAGEQAAIIAVNLSVADAEEADELAFNLITTALTLAREDIPAALAAYNHQRVVLTTAVTDPREILNRALSLVKDITLIEPTKRHLEPPDIARLKRDITQLKRAKSEPAQQLLGMLDFEYRAMEKAAKNHPATIALSSVTANVPPPAMIVMVSQLNHDAEALLITAEKLAKREFATLPLQGASW